MEDYLQGQKYTRKSIKEFDEQHLWDGINSDQAESMEKYRGDLRFYHCYYYFTSWVLDYLEGQKYTYKFVEKFNEQYLW